jgi:hypothetical protein
MLQFQSKPALGGEFTKLQVQTLEASHRLQAMRRHLEAIAAEPPIPNELGSFNALVVLLAITAGLLVFL